MKAGWFLPQFTRYFIWLVLSEVKDVDVDVKTTNHSQVNCYVTNIILISENPSKIEIDFKNETSKLSSFCFFFILRYEIVIVIIGVLCDIWFQKVG